MMLFERGRLMALPAFLAFLLILLFSVSALAEEGGDGPEPGVNDDGSISMDKMEAGESRTCPDAKVISGKLITDICWKCIFPMRIMGVDVGGRSAPRDAARKVFCLCFDNNNVPELGIGVGIWEPARLIEIVREPGCTPTLAGAKLPGTGQVRWGTAGKHTDSTDNNMFYHYRYYVFPILLMLDLYVPTGCFSDGYTDMDLIYISELDPTWNNDELAFFTAPEAGAVANLAAQSACLVDAASTAVGVPLDSFWWCMGSWGSTYPLAGKTIRSGFANQTSLLASRAVAALHRRGLARKTMGEDNMCEANIFPFLPKQQYRMSMFFPVAEAKNNHVMGETVATWGWGRMLPGFGEDAVYMLWRWNDCCMTY